MSSIILASGSPRRKKLLARLGFAFSVVPSNLPEQYDPDRTIESIVQHLARDKACSVAANRSDALVIGADTIVSFGGSKLEKPTDKEHAFRMLSQLSDRTHEVFTGVSIVKNDEEGNITKEHTFFEMTEVTFGELDDHEISQYINTDNPMDKAGGYGIQDNWGAVFVKKINGDYYNVMGLPLHRLYLQLKRMAPGLFERSGHA